MSKVYFYWNDNAKRENMSEEIVCMTIDVYNHKAEGWIFCFCPAPEKHGRGNAFPTLKMLGGRFKDLHHRLQPFIWHQCTHSMSVDITHRLAVIIRVLASGGSQQGAKVPSPPFSCPIVSNCGWFLTTVELSKLCRQHRQNPHQGTAARWEWLLQWRTLHCPDGCLWSQIDPVYT